MTSVSYGLFNLAAHQRPTVGDTKMSVVGVDHMGWLKCDGRLLNVADHRFLFDVVEYSFGGSGTQFRLPDPRGGITGYLGTGTDTDVFPDQTNRNMGDLSGEEFHTLNINEMPAHTHGSVDVTGNNNGDGLTGNTSLDLTQTTVATGVSVSINDNGVSSLVGDTNVVTGVSAITVDPSITPNPHNHTIGSTGGGQRHNNIQPTLFLGNLFIYSGKKTTFSTANPTNAWPFTSGYYVGDNSRPREGKNVV